jgi:hypothetical protein
VQLGGQSSHCAVRFRAGADASPSSRTSPRDPGAEHQRDPVGRTPFPDVSRRRLGSCAERPEPQLWLGSRSTRLVVGSGCRSSGRYVARGPDARAPSGQSYDATL